MDDKKYKKFIKRYDKFKNNNLPTKFWDEERATTEYISFDNDKLNIQYNLTDALGEIAYTNLYYPYIDKHLEGTANDLKEVVAHNHSHTFEEVLEALYYSPESFKIEKDDELYYSSQELRYLKSIQKYLLFIGLKDYEEKQENRVYNEKHAKYLNCKRITLKQEIINKIKNKELEFIAFKYIDYNFSPYEALILNEDDYYLHILIKNMKEIKYSDIKDKFEISNCLDEETIGKYDIDILEVFK